MNRPKNFKSKALEIYNSIKSSKNSELEKAIEKAVEKQNFKNHEEKEEEIIKLRQQVKEIIAENRKKEAKINKMLEMDDLDNLEDIRETMKEDYEVATPKERERLANKIIFLAESIKDNEFLAKKTLEHFNYYREKMITRNLKEKDMGTNLTNIN
ncbi:hypothetical protein [Orenia marismortui]|uniref:Uncharacterized protein n=1 Tax=Orenia marismortui TaxID=46469 RepID=A0A4R8GXQ3_9FIRM|nr:hypothetical protein [Orenia marismortui]TDX46777.1 hypothetical protein C7959_1369 [Orenia marismortui]